MDWQRKDVDGDVYFDNGSGKRVEVCSMNDTQWRVQFFDKKVSHFALEDYTEESRNGALELAEELIQKNSDD